MYHSIMRLPLFWWYTLSLMAGITTAQYLAPSYALCGGALIIFVVCWVDEYFSGFIQKISRSVFFCFMGSILLYTQKESHRIIINTYAHKPLYCKGTVVEYTPTPHLPLRHKITLKLHSISTDAGGHWHKISGYSLTIQTKNTYEYLIGSDIVIENITLKPSSSSFTLFCIRTGILGTIHKPQLTYTIIKRPFFSVTRTLFLYKKRMLTFFKNHMNMTTFTLFSALFLGNSDLIKEKLKEYHCSFQHWGIIHYLARSGLHLVIVTALLEYLLYILPWSFTVGRLAILGGACLYWILSWASLSFYRALMVFILSHTARIARKQHHFLHILLFTCSIFLIINPITLFFLDFQLTFGITVGLGIFNYTTYAPFI